MRCSVQGPPRRRSNRIYNATVLEPKIDSDTVTEESVYLSEDLDDALATLTHDFDGALMPPYKDMVEVHDQPEPEVLFELEEVDLVACIISELNFDEDELLFPLTGKEVWQWTTEMNDDLLATLI